MNSALIITCGPLLGDFGGIMLRLTIFGRFSAAGADGADIPLKSQRARALLAYLALPPGKLRSREEIMALLWSERGEAKFSKSLISSAYPGVVLTIFTSDAFTCEKPIKHNETKTPPKINPIEKPFLMTALL